MIGDGQVSIVGTLKGDPEITFTASGRAVVRLRVATSLRSAIPCVVWGRAAEEVAEALSGGDVVMVRGTLAPRGDHAEIIVEHVGPSLTAHRPVRMVGGAAR